MNIGIVSMLSNNYGALLQSYALQTVIERLGGHVTIVNRRWGRLLEKVSVMQKIRYVKQCIVYKQNAYDIFRKKYLHLSKKVRTNQDLIDINKNLDLVITGSDQVWHDGCSDVMGLYFFLDWVDYPVVKRFSYAASFGKDSFSKQNAVVKEISNLLNTFSGISVRESSGVDICMNVFGVSASCHLDPTLLLDKDDYNTMLPSYDCTNTVCCYMLDNNPQKDDLVKRIADDEGCSIISNMAMNTKDCIPVEKWMQNIRDSRFVITDSFHGMVFSIIFGKQFVCINNKKRGSERFESLLEMLELKDRLIDIECMTYSHIHGLLIKPILYQELQEKLYELRELSLKYLKSIINNG